MPDLRGPLRRACGGLGGAHRSLGPRRPARRALGSGSKATSFLTALGIRDEIEQVVDINPNRQGMFLATCGQEIVAPERLVERPPDLVIAVNPIYREEIRRQLRALGLEPELLTLSP